MVKRIFCVAAFGFVLTANVSAQDAAVGSSGSAAASAVNEVSSPVKAWEGKITMPTYLLDPAEQSPIFERDWSYQRAKRSVYPYPLND
ncbi:MAG: hypothetical protein PUH74_05435, partial [Bacteroidales bacterium]|nr:hypothetical protein [Bacteroidales bacterium]